MNTTMHAHWISLLHEHYALLAHSSVQNTTHGLKYPLTTEYGPISTLLNPHLDMSIAFVCLYDPSDSLQGEIAPGTATQD